jgi:hypothetical protein
LAAIRTALLRTGEIKRAAARTREAWMACDEVLDRLRGLRPGRNLGPGVVPVVEAAGLPVGPADKIFETGQQVCGGGQPFRCGERVRTRRFSDSAET